MTAAERLHSTRQDPRRDPLDEDADQYLEVEPSGPVDGDVEADITRGKPPRPLRRSSPIKSLLVSSTSDPSPGQVGSPERRRPRRSPSGRSLSGRSPSTVISSTSPKNHFSIDSILGR